MPTLCASPVECRFAAITSSTSRELPVAPLKHTVDTIDSLLWQRCRFPHQGAWVCSSGWVRRWTPLVVATAVCNSRAWWSLLAEPTAVVPGLAHAGLADLGLLDPDATLEDWMVRVPVGGLLTAPGGGTASDAAPLCRAAWQACSDAYSVLAMQKRDRL